MVRLKLDQESFGLASLLERSTGVVIKDCFMDGATLYAVVAPGQLGKAVGRGGANVQRLQRELGKKIKMIEFREDAAEFVKNVIYPVVAEEIREEEEAIIIKDRSYSTKSLLIGRDGKNLKLINRAVQRFFRKEVKVV